MAKKQAALLDEEIDDSSSLSFPLPPTHLPKRKKKSFSGWRCGILSGTVFAIVVLALNIIVVVRFRAISSNNSTKASGTIYEGSCDKTRKINLVMHLIINCFSTVLLAASNYAMQCLIAPTRPEINAAHAKRYWLDIGVASVRNVRHIGRKRLALWCLLIATSLPLHLLYNSAVYSSISSNDYVVFFLDEHKTQAPSGMFDEAAVAHKFDAEFKDGSLERLGPADCIKAYATPIQTRYGHVGVYLENLPQQNISSTVVSAQTHRFQDLLSTDGVIDPAFWICGRDLAVIPSGNNDQSTCLSQTKSIDPSNWMLHSRRVSFCLVEPRPEKCNIRYSPPIAYIVIVCNFLKILFLISTFWIVVENPIATVGDAIMSFIRYKDTSTAGYCLMGRHKIGLWSQPYLPEDYHRRQTRWKDAASKRRWCLSITLYIGFLTICTLLFIHGLTGNTNASASTLMGFDIGAVTPQVFISGNGWAVPKRGTAGLILNVLVANSPQLILSAIYYTYNGLFTCFNVAKEWSSYAVHRRGLRVSENPQGQQRSTYFLQLPYRYAFPLMLLSLVLHWLCSQSIFLVSIASDTIAMDTPYSSYDWTDTNEEFYSSKIPSENDYNYKFGGATQVYTCGYSAKALMFTIIAGVVMVLIAIIMGSKKLQGTSIPMASTCSASISAMCHLPEGEDGAEAATSRLQWGDVGPFAVGCAVEFKFTDDDDEYEDEDGKVRHCSFSSKQVSEPVEGHSYA